MLTTKLIGNDTCLWSSMRIAKLSTHQPMSLHIICWYSEGSPIQLALTHQGGLILHPTSLVCRPRWQNYTILLSLSWCWQLPNRNPRTRSLVSAHSKWTTPFGCLFPPQENWIWNRNKCWLWRDLWMSDRHVNVRHQKKVVQVNRIQPRILSSFRMIMSNNLIKAMNVPWIPPQTEYFVDCKSETLSTSAATSSTESIVSA